VGPRRLSSCGTRGGNLIRRALDLDVSYQDVADVVEPEDEDDGCELGTQLVEVRVLGQPVEHAQIQHGPDATHEPEPDSLGGRPPEVHLAPHFRDGVPCRTEPYLTRVNGPYGRSGDAQNQLRTHRGDSSAPGPGVRQQGLLRGGHAAESG